VIELTFGEKLKELRLQNAMSQRELAKKLDITQRTIRGWELEGRMPKQRCQYDALAVALGCPVAYLLNEEPLETPTTQPPCGNAASVLILQQAIDLFAANRIPKREQKAFIMEIERIYISTSEDLS